MGGTCFKSVGVGDESLGIVPTSPTVHVSPKSQIAPIIQSHHTKPEQTEREHSKSTRTHAQTHGESVDGDLVSEFASATHSIHSRVKPSARNNSFFRNNTRIRKITDPVEIASPAMQRARYLEESSHAAGDLHTTGLVRRVSITQQAGLAGAPTTVLQDLQLSPLSHALPLPILDNLAKCFRVIHCVPGEVIFAPGEEAFMLFLIRSGVVAIRAERKIADDSMGSYGAPAPFSPRAAILDDDPRHRDGMNEADRSFQPIPVITTDSPHSRSRPSHSRSYSQVNSPRSPQLKSPLNFQFNPFANTAAKSSLHTKQNSSGNFSSFDLNPSLGPGLGIEPNTPNDALPPPVQPVLRKSSIGGGGSVTRKMGPRRKSSEGSRMRVSTLCSRFAQTHHVLNSPNNSIEHTHDLFSQTNPLQQGNQSVSPLQKAQQAGTPPHAMNLSSRPVEGLSTLDSMHDSHETLAMLNALTVPLMRKRSHELFGQESLRSHQQLRVTWAVCETPVTLLVLHNHDFQMFLQSYPDSVTMSFPFPFVHQPSLGSVIDEASCVPSNTVSSVATPVAPLADICMPLPYPPMRSTTVYQEEQSELNSFMTPSTMAQPSISASDLNVIAASPSVAGTSFMTNTQHGDTSLPFSLASVVPLSQPSYSVPTTTASNSINSSVHIAGLSHTTSHPIHTLHQHSHSTSQSHHSHSHSISAQHHSSTSIMSGAEIRSRIIARLGHTIDSVLESHLPELSRAKLALLSSLFHFVHFEPGDVIMKEGEYGSYVYATHNNVIGQNDVPTISAAATTVSPPDGTALSASSTFTAIPVNARKGSVLRQRSLHATPQSSNAKAPSTPPTPNPHQQQTESTRTVYHQSGNNLYFLMTGVLSCTTRGESNTRRFCRIFDSSAPIAGSKEAAAAAAAAAAQPHQQHGPHHVQQLSNSHHAAPGIHHVHQYSASGLKSISSSPIDAAITTPVATVTEEQSDQNSHHRYPSAGASPRPPVERSISPVYTGSFNPLTSTFTWTGSSPNPLSPPMVSANASGGAASTYVPPIKQATNPGFFGELGLLFDIPRSATITAMSDCVLLELSQDRWRNFLQLAPEVLGIFQRRLTSSYSIHVSHLLFNPLVARNFLDFCRREYSGENYACWQACKQFRLNFKKHLLHSARNKTSAEDIVQNFISSEGETPVNLRGATVTTIMGKWKSGILDSDMFVEVEEEALSLMNTDSFVRYKTSDAFQKVLGEINANHLESLSSRSRNATNAAQQQQSNADFTAPAGQSPTTARMQRSLSTLNGTSNSGTGASFQLTSVSNIPAAVPSPITVHIATRASPSPAKVNVMDNPCTTPTPPMSFGEESLPSFLTQTSTVKVSSPPLNNTLLHQRKPSNIIVKDLSGSPTPIASARTFDSTAPPSSNESSAPTSATATAAFPRTTGSTAVFNGIDSRVRPSPVSILVAARSILAASSNDADDIRTPRANGEIDEASVSLMASSQRAETQQQFV